MFVFIQIHKVPYLAGDLVVISVVLALEATACKVESPVAAGDGGGHGSQVGGLCRDHFAAVVAPLDHIFCQLSDLETRQVMCMHDSD